MPLKKRVQIIIIFSLIFTILYFSAARWTISPEIHHLPFLPFERSIPFIPFTLFIYILCYIVPPAAFLLIDNKRNMQLTMRAFLMALFFQYIIWMIYPVSYPDRPLEHPTNDWIESLVYSLYWLDNPPLNCFPSLHVSFAFLSYFTIRAFVPRWKYWFLLLAVAISVSTLTLKQHYVLDVVSGFIVALALDLFTLRGWGRRYFPDIFPSEQ